MKTNKRMVGRESVLVQHVRLAPNQTRTCHCSRINWRSMFKCYGGHNWMLWLYRIPILCPDTPIPVLVKATGILSPLTLLWIFSNVFKTFLWQRCELTTNEHIRAHRKWTKLALASRSQDLPHRMASSRWTYKVVCRQPIHVHSTQGNVRPNTGLHVAPQPINHGNTDNELVSWIGLVEPVT